MMRQTKSLLYLLILLASFLFFSCEDHFDYSSQVIGEGESAVEATLQFKTNVTNLGSRSSGLAVSTIESLHIVIYKADEDKSYFNLINNVNFTTVSNDPSSTPSDYPDAETDEDGSVVGGTSEEILNKVRFNTKLPYGKYYIYAVANLGRNLTEEEVQTIDALKSIQCDWDFETMNYDPESETPGKQINAQMFGYFTNNDKQEDPNKYGSAFAEEDPMVVINKPQVQLHSWIKRLASKVTIAYDGHGLHNGVYVYIHNVSIRQIPYKCYLGKDNNPQGYGPEGKDEKGGVTEAFFDKSEEVHSQVLCYNKDGYTPAYSSYSDGLKNGVWKDEWMEIARGSKILGAKDHSNNAPALFFFENMKGVHPDNLKPQQRDSVGSNVNEDDYEKDYQDGIAYGTFIEVEAYYRCDTIPVSEGPIRYRFMLGQNITDNYNAARNSHYKLTLGFDGYANQPDWHIEYYEPIPIIYAPEVFIPYTYNTSVTYPLRVTGHPTTIEVELIENNWAPWDYDKQKLPPAENGGTDFDTRTLEFKWWREVYENGNGDKSMTPFPAAASNDETRNFYTALSVNDRDNYLYGRHRSSFRYLNEEGTAEVTTTTPDSYYHVTPVWAGFLRLLQPTDYADESNLLDATLYPSTGDGPSYNSVAQVRRFRDYYSACPESREGAKNLGKRTFYIDNPENDPLNTGRNAYRVIKEYDAEGNVKGVTVEMNLWTQPKSMCGISGFSGNNPYEDYTRKAVFRVTAHYDPNDVDFPPILMKDVTVYQTERLVNPKGVWRSHELQKETDKVFNVILYKRDTGSPKREDFEKIISEGAWTARILDTKNLDDFISIGTEGQTVVTGATKTNVEFPIIFKGNIKPTESKCAIIEVRYHGNNCVHNIFVRQGFHTPLKISEKAGAPYWSSYNVFSCGDSLLNNGYYPNLTSVNATFTYNPIALGSFFKRGNHYEAISVANIQNKDAGFGPLGAPGSNQFILTRRSVKKNWTSIQGETGATWQWNTKFVVKEQIVNGDDVTETTCDYRVPTVEDFETLREKEFGIGVLYCNGATAPADKTGDAYGFLDNYNIVISSGQGMRGIICYDPDDANQIFFPVATMGIGRRTNQGANDAYAGTLRYGALDTSLPMGTNSLRPICYNISNACGAIYWTFARANNHAPGWDMNYTDLNFNQYDDGITGANGGDAIPLRLVCDKLPEVVPKN